MIDAFALTAVLADATNLGLTWMAEACRCRQLSAARLDGKPGICARKPTARGSRSWLTPSSASRSPPRSVPPMCPARMDSTSPTAGPGEAVGAVNAHYETPPHPHFSIRTSRLARAPLPYGLRSRLPAKPPMLSMACSTTRPT